MEYPDDNHIPIFHFPFYARKSKVKEKAPVRNSGAFLFSTFIILPQVKFLLSKGTGPGVCFSLKKFRKNFLFLKPRGVFFRLGGVKGAKNTV